MEKLSLLRVRAGGDVAREATSQSCERDHRQAGTYSQHTIVPCLFPFAFTCSVST